MQEETKPTEYRVDLEIYNGPLDLLLYLIRRDELDIYDIPIAHITKQYCKYVDLLKQIDLTLAGEFMVLAASLIELKTRMLLPRPVIEDDDSEAIDPRLELVRQLLEYKKFKDVASELGESAQLAASRYPPAFRKDDLRFEKASDQLDLRDVVVWDLLEAFDKLMAATFAGKYQHEVIYDDISIDVYEDDIMDRLKIEGSMSFNDVFLGRVNKSEIIGLFLALLELIRQKFVRAEQSKTTEQIYIFPIAAEGSQGEQANEPDNSP